MGAMVALEMMLGALIDGVGIVFLIPVVAIVTNNISDPVSSRVLQILSALDITQRTGKCIVLFGAFLALLAARAVVLRLRDIGQARLRVRFVEAQRTKLVNRLAAAPWDRLSRLQHARVNHLLGSDVVLTGSCVHHLLQVAASAVLVAVQWGLALLISPFLTLWAAALLLLACGILSPKLAKSRSLGRAVCEGNHALAVSGGRFLAGLKPAVSQNLQHAFAGEFNENLNSIMEKQVELARVQSTVQIGFVTLSSFIGVLAVLAGLLLIDMPASVLVVFVVVLARTGAPLGKLQQSLQQFVSLLPSYDQICAMNSELGVAGPAAATSAPRLTAPPPIRFHAVAYRHPGSAAGLGALDISIPPGSFLGIAGPSGAGKTTFADLLVGLIAPQSGEILLGNRLLAGDLRTSWRASIAYVPQDTFLFHDSIRNNLLWGNRDIAERELLEALEIAGATEITSRLGLDAIVGERGSLLSGGERQRLAIVRALLRRPVLLVLDEATNALDTASERCLLSNLARLESRPTIVLIAHRAESLEYCDHIVEFDGGGIVAVRGRAGSAMAAT